MANRNNEAIVKEKFELTNKRKHKNASAFERLLTGKPCKQPETIYGKKIIDKRELRRKKNANGYVYDRSNLVC